jgi:hypothetical protein
VPRCVVVVVAVGTIAFRAYAGEPDAIDLFARARELRLRGNCAAAVPLFRHAYDTYPAGLGSLRNIAECEEELGRTASARRAWLDLARALVTNHLSKYEGWGADAAQAAQRLAAKVATLTVEVHAATPSGEPAPTSGVDVRVGDEALSPASVGHPLEVDPGHYVVRAQGAESSGASQRTVDLAAGDSKRVELPIVVAPRPDRDAILRQAPARRTAAWIAMGAGVAGFIGAAIAGVARQSALDELTAACGSTTSCPRAQGNPTEASNVHAIEERGHAAATWVNALTIAGAIGVAGGVLLYATAASHRPGAAFLVSPSGIYAVGRY